MHSCRHSFRRARAGYTLVEVLAASGLIAAAIGAAAALSMTMTKQEEVARGQACAIRYAEAVARLWQLGVNPSAILLSQPQGIAGANSYSIMSWTITPGSPASLGDTAEPEGAVETANVTVTWRPFGSDSNATVSFNAIRPPAAHR